MSTAARRFRLLVFDWDGTLIDSIASIVACTHAALEDLELAGPPDDEIRGTVGLGLRDVLARLWPEGAPPEHERLMERYRHHWLTTYGRRGELFAGVDDTLAALEERGYLLAVATGKGRTGLERDLRATGLDGRFLASRTVDEAASKPNPQMLLELMDELGAGGKETLMIGDTTFDLDMARNAGAAAVGVLTGPHGADDLLACAPLACLASVAELPAWLDGRAPA